jgi:CBS domain-containing protein
MEPADNSAPDVIELEAAPAEPPPLPAGAKKTASEPPAPLSVLDGLPAKRWPPAVVGDLMTRQIIAINEEEPLGDIEAGMKHFRFRHLPVVSGGKKLVGLISQSDFLHALLGVGPDGAPLASKTDGNTRASSIMRRNVVTARMDSPLQTACQIMVQEKLSCLPVVDEHANLVGILTETDFVKLTSDQFSRGTAV